MIVRPRPTAFGLLFILRGSIVPVVAPRVGLIVAVAAVVVAVDRMAPGHLQAIGPAPFTLLGLGLSIFLGFRNNAAYERWWEGRRHWGTLLAETRSLLRDLSVLLPGDGAAQRRCTGRAVAFARALRDQLRGDADTAGPLLPEAERAGVAAARSRPEAILLLLAAEFGDQRRRGLLSDVAYGLLAGHLRELTGVQCACERLHATPMPFTYTLLLHRSAWLFCLLLPFGMLGTLGLTTPLISAILGYAFFGLDALGEELEEPFGRTQNALPLDALVRIIEIAAAEALGDPEVPEPLRPEAFLLL